MNLSENEVLKSLREKMSDASGNGDGKKPDVSTASSGKSDIDWMKVESVEPVEIDIESIKKQAQEKKETVFQRAQDYHKRYLALKKLSSLSQEELSLGGVWNQFHALQKANLGIIAGVKRARETDSQTAEQFCFNVLLCRINATEPKKDDEVVEIFNIVANGGSVVAPLLPGEGALTIHRRGRIPSAAETASYKLSRPPFRCFFYDDAGKMHQLVHIPSEMSGSLGEISPADKVLFAVLNGLVKRYRVYREKRKDVEMKEDEKKIAALLKTSSNPPAAILQGIKGTYVFFLPGKEVGGKKIGRDGAGIVKVYDLNERKKGLESFYVIEPIDGAGSMSSFSKNKGTWVSLKTLFYYRKNKEIPENKVKEEIREFALLVCRRVSAAIGYAASQK